MQQTFKRTQLLVLWILLVVLLLHETVLAQQYEWEDMVGVMTPGQAICYRWQARGFNCYWDYIVMLCHCDI